MNCREFQDALQDQLDGLCLPHADSFQIHLQGCARCREWNNAVGRLKTGLRHLVPPTPAPDLSSRLVSAILADSRNRRALAYRRAWMVAAVAASFLLVFLAGDQWLSSPTPLPFSTLPSEGTPAPVASLRESVNEAGSAVASLTRRTADEVMDHGKAFLDVMAVPQTPDTVLPSSPMDPPVRSLAVAGQAIGTGLEPVANSARRAWDLFIRDVPLPPDDKPGL